MDILFFAIWFMLGLCVGSFCNVLIYRIPKGEEFVRTPSHCVSCGHSLKWYELIPLVSWLIQGGKCRACGAKVSAQYPIVETLNGIAWLITALLFREAWITALLYCGLFSLLVVLSFIDWRTYTIPNGISLAIFLLGMIRVITDLGQWSEYLIGLISVSAFFLLLYFLTGGSGLGMGDVKLVGAAGLLLGWQKILFAVIIGSVLGALIHSLRMKSGSGRKLAFGPYLSVGIWVSALVGKQIITAYLGLFGL